MKFAVLRRTVSRSAIGKLTQKPTPLQALASGDVRLTVEDHKPDARTELLRDPGVDEAAPIMPITAMPTKLIKPVGMAGHGAVPGWGIAAIGADKSVYSGKGARVAVLDTGIDSAHPAFAGMNLVEKDFTGEGNGDQNGHGTHCAGTVFGRDVGNQRIGVARGVQDAYIGKVLDKNGDGESSMIFDALLWALQSRVHVVSVSLGFDFPGMVGRLVSVDGIPPESATSMALEAFTSNLRMFDSIMLMYKASAAFGGAPLVVAATGNESRRSLASGYTITASLPASAADVLSVAAVSQVGSLYEIAEFSNTKAGIAAPGVAIESAALGGGLVEQSGTSMACPHVAGACALWWEALKATGKMPSSANMLAHVLSMAKGKIFVPGTQQDDIGAGLVYCP